MRGGFIKWVCFANRLFLENQRFSNSENSFIEFSDYVRLGGSKN
jgi:hypothetical protein